MDGQEREGTLFLAINEAVLRESAECEKAYVTDQEALDDTYGPGRLTVETLGQRWLQVVKLSYWEVWFDDNVGHFLVQISYEPSSE